MPNAELDISKAPISNTSKSPNIQLLTFIFYEDIYLLRDQFSIGRGDHFTIGGSRPA